jgi:hypothetical protein
MPGQVGDPPIKYMGNQRFLYEKRKSAGKEIGPLLQKKYIFLHAAFIETARGQPSSKVLAEATQEFQTREISK